MLVLILTESWSVHAQTLDLIAPSEIVWPTDTTFAEQLEEAEQQLKERGSSDPLIFEKARLEHLLGAKGDRDLARSAYQALRGLHERYPDDPVISAYFGSAMMLRAQRAWLFTTKGRLVEEGGDLMKRSLEAAPDDAEVHAVIGLSLVDLPDWMEQQAEGQEQIRLGAQLAQGVDAPRRWSPALRAMMVEAYARHSGEALDPDSRRALLETAVSLAPESDAGQRAEQRLREMASP
ncbi:hypothetical protein [Mucisphaera calidilacus]|uniref:Tetratricopeptide repeat protein n=1 Tax=Mucisphaera calidilacus TaxID=2527982 RepID=A0A518BV05_9BACT|nr:hypothetical protein [Mucisphaera calidilacus]QDU70799.1 hypothetical protein Pan265_06360 [Mucisphaera calidilacus]